MEQLLIRECEELARQAMEELLSQASTREDDIVVVGCSTSEVAGMEIGTSPQPEIAAALLRGLLAPVHRRRLFFAAQCCEHLNRALVINSQALLCHSLVQVNALPRPNAGGAFATAAWKMLEDPIAVEAVSAAAGIDIGGTMIGMHLRPVAVPVRLSVQSIGKAWISAARTRPKFVGGERTFYDETLL